MVMIDEILAFTRTNNFKTTQSLFVSASDHLAPRNNSEDARYADAELISGRESEKNHDRI